MMINMLIVDDEPVICQGLTATIPWSDIGVEVVGTACNGKEALSLMYQESIDLVLTDVYMPEMDGLALSQHISTDFPESRIIVMSGYDEFEYARQALRLGVEDYLLKPVDVDDLLELVKQVRERIIETKRDEQNHRQELISQQILHHLFGSPISSADIQNGENVISSYRLLISELADYYVLKDTYTEKALTRLREEWKIQVDQAFFDVGIDSVSFFGHDNELITIPYSMDAFELDVQQMKSVCDSIVKVNGYLFRKVITHPQNNLSAIPQLREGIRTILEEYRTDNESMIFIENDRQEKVETPSPEIKVTHLQEAISKQDETLLSDILDDMFHHFEKQRLSLLQVLNVSRELVSALKKQVQHYDNHLEKVNFILHKDVDLKVYNSYQAIKHLFMMDMSNLAEVLHMKSDHHWMIESAKKYIQKNYQQDIKASDVAEEHFITPNYFSTLFKQETGYSYSEYLNMIRIKKASELLIMESNKVYEIAEYVGYKEYKYFAHIFKAHHGMTPTQYRSLNVSGSKI